MREFCSFFGIRKGITALIGGGGKTSTMYALADYLRMQGSVIVCTSTHIQKPPQYPYCPRIEKPLQSGEVYATGMLNGQKLSCPEQSFCELKELADYVIVEADGSRQLPLKAHASHEPVIPPEADRVLAIIGIDGLDRKISEAAHRPERYAAICGADPDAIVTAQMIHDVVSTYPRFDGIVINKADDADRIAKAEALAALFDVPVAITAWQTEHPIKCYRRNHS